MPNDDQYSRVDYRRMIAWPERLQREGPFFDAIFSDAHPRRLVDVGVNDVEGRGIFEVVGVDSSASLLEKAREAPPMEGASFVAGDIRDLQRVVDGPFGGALCIGNVLPHMTTAAEIESFFGGIAAVLASGAPLVLQILNYDRIIDKGERYLPLNFREGENGEVVFLRLMSPKADGTVLFFPTTLELRQDDEDEPIRVAHARRVVLRGWRGAEVDAACRLAGFREVTLLGSYEREAFDPASSKDLVVVARR